MAEEHKTVRVEPTKELFVYIITRDIDIVDAVIDLIDNCIDGAKRLRNGKTSKIEKKKLLEGLNIDIKFDASSFEIKDNCGGIPLDVAEKYAFRFGRAKDMQPTPGSVGQFGVGMKRALFKFGRRFSVESKTTNDSFNLLVDVDNWLENDRWTFELRNVGNGTTARRAGTKIRVDKLNREAQAAFSDSQTFTRIVNEIRLRQQHFIEQGLAVTVNGQLLRAELFQIKTSGKLHPAYWDHTYEKVSEPNSFLEDDVRVEIYVGVGKSSPENAGWYVVCNGRVVLDADKTTTTAWGTPGPHYHNQYAQFRGYVFFESDNAGVLPWTTTKANIDENNYVYRQVREEMFRMGLPVIRFLDAVDREKDVPKQQRQLTRMVEKAELANLSTEITKPVFEFEEPKRQSGPSMDTISFKRPKDQVRELKDIYEVGTAREVGEEAFDEAYRRYFEE